MTPDEELRVLKMLATSEWWTAFWIKTNIWAKWLAGTAAAVAGFKYLVEIIKGMLK